MNEEQYPKIYLYRRIVQAKLFIDNFYSEKINLSNIADEAYFSKFHFIRLFKKSYNRTPHQYLIYVRIENAKRLLQAGNKVADICFAVGFESISSFTGLFKKLSGLTPAAYQVQQLATKDAIAKTPLNYIPGCFAEQNGWKKELPLIH
ncbi:MAG: AraC family transcriptional regulator [Ferruginibacter sp.]